VDYKGKWVKGGTTIGGKKGGTGMEKREKEGRLMGKGEGKDTKGIYRQGQWDKGTWKRDREGNLGRRKNGKGIGRDTLGRRGNGKGRARGTWGKKDIRKGRDREGQ
jgi:hypothetical protein